MDTAKPQNPCTDLSEIRRWGAEGWEKGFAVSLFVSKVPRHINEKNNRNKNKEGKERGIKMDTQQMFQELPSCAGKTGRSGRENDGLDEGRAGFREQKPLPDDVQ